MSELDSVLTGGKNWYGAISQEENQTQSNCSQEGGKSSLYAGYGKSLSFIAH